jgi:hypothetical protein
MELRGFVPLKAAHNHLLFEFSKKGRNEKERARQIEKERERGETETERYNLLF